MDENKRTTRTKPSKRKLIKFSEEHLYFEIWFELDKMIKGKTPGTPLCNALLESFIVHAAILIEFFYRKPPHREVARASDYFKNLQEWEEILPPYKKDLDVLWKRRNTELAHLSYKRLKIKPEQKFWKIRTTTLQIRTIVNQFLENADSELLHPNLYNLKTILRDRHH